MKEDHKKFIKVFAALLPISAMLTSAAVAFWLASLLGAALLFVTHLFLILRPIFPKPAFRIALVLTLAAIFQLVQGFFHPEPFWVVSLALLLDWNDFDPKHLGQRPLPPLVRTGIFWLGALFLGVVRENLGKRFGIALFEQPAGFFAVLAVFSAFILSLEKPLAPFWLQKRRRA